MKKIFSLILVLLALPSLAWGQYSPNYRKGYAAYELGDYNEALNYFEQDLATNPQSGATLTMCALLYNQGGEHKKTLDLADKALLYLDKKDKSSIALCQCLCGASYAALGDTAQAIKFLDKAIKTDKSYTAPIREKINILYAQGKMEKALKECENLVEIEPSNPTNFYFYAYTLANAGQTDKAIEQISRSIRLAPNAPFYYGQRANYYGMAEDYAHASDDIVQCITLGGNANYFSRSGVSISNCPAIVPKLKGVISRDRDNVAASYYLATLQENAGMTLDGARTLKESYEAVPSANTAYYLATDLYHAGLYKEASDWATLCLETDTTYSASPYLLVSNIAYDAGETEYALQAINTYIELTHNDWGYYRRGWIYEHSGRRFDAMSDYTTAIYMDPEHAYYYMKRGDLYQKQNDTSKAQADFQKTIDLEVNGDEMPECMQYAFHYLNDDDSAAEVMEAILSADPSSGNYYDAACLYSLMGQEETALTYLEKSLQMGFRRFKHIELDDDLDNLRNLPRFKSLISRYKTIHDQEVAEAATEFSAPKRKYAIAYNETASNESGGINIDDIRSTDSSTNTPTGTPIVVDNTIVEVPARYPGGEAGLLNFVNRNVVYPAVAVKNNVEGTVILRFKVDTDGSVSDVKIEKSLSPECDRAAAAVVKKLRKFIPAKQKGKPVPVWFRLPIRFRIS